MEVVAVDVRDPRLEAVADPRVGVLADRDEEVGAEVGAPRSRRARRRSARPPRHAVVEEEVLELVEDHERSRVERARGRDVSPSRRSELQLGAVRGKGRRAVPISATKVGTGSSRQPLKTTGT